ncbi:hypothetical protein Pan44_37090 [Caulifigura coniformis]|uniref:BON domain protein n=1 Tax=Caulifigura coniformis TaxID=2527983 RepID=A0A517SHR2_9PLAN|nr:hypothetical protein [Caulifigura coniformis]QDT55663.1 hypothetical protein Pan44_37090 [Caulifigura coniformis]
MLLEASPAATAVAKNEAARAAIDETLVARIERIVRCRTGGRIRDLRVDVSEKRVVISGQTTTYYAKQLVTHAALDEIRDRALTNAIEVQ